MNIFDLHFNICIEFSRILEALYAHTIGQMTTNNVLLRACFSKRFDEYMHMRQNSQLLYMWMGRKEFFIGPVVGIKIQSCAHIQSNYIQILYVCVYLT